jgi:hypothetical protein
MTLDDFRPILETTAATQGLVLDFLMKTWNGRFATYNVGIPTAEIGDARRGVRDEARYYRLLGRVKATTQDGKVVVILNPPTACDVTPTEAEQLRWDAFAAEIQSQLDLSRF